MKTFCVLTACILMLGVAMMFGQEPKYRTFNQDDLSQKKSKAGKALSSNVSFHFINNSGHTATSLHVRFNSAVITVVNAGGFSSVTFIDEKQKVMDAQDGITVAPGDSVVFSAVFAKKSSGTKVNFGWWDSAGSPISGSRFDTLNAWSDTRNYTQPNGGTVREFLYKKVIKRPVGLVVGVPTDTPNVGWLRFMKDDRKYFPHTGVSRCLDFVETGSGKAIVGENKNWHVKKHDNHLLGELHVLKLAVVANDSGVTEPMDTTALGDLIYNDAGNVSDPGNGKTVRQIVALADSALTYCAHFSLMPEIYSELDTCISRINSAFDGEYHAVSFTPFLVSGTHTVSETPYLHPNPSVIPVAGRRSAVSLLDIQPQKFLLAQNYPNPFNPSTTISFDLAKDAVVTLKVYNLLGQEVATLLNNENIEEGLQSVEFDASNLPSGVYLYKITGQEIGGNAKSFQSTKKMVLLK